MPHASKATNQRGKHLPQAKALKSNSPGLAAIDGPSSDTLTAGGGHLPLSHPPLSSGMKVCVRVRPSNERENTFDQVVHIVDDRVLIFDPNLPATPAFLPGSHTSHPLAHPATGLTRARAGGVSGVSGRTRRKDLKFMFSRVFEHDASNEHVFADTTAQILDAFLSGVNCSVFAYGATGAGKTYTMLGVPGDNGKCFDNGGTQYGESAGYTREFRP